MQVFQKKLRALDSINYLKGSSNKIGETTSSQKSQVLPNGIYEVSQYDEEALSQGDLTSIIVDKDSFLDLKHSDNVKIEMYGERLVYSVVVTLNETGTKKLEDLTEQNQGKPLAIMINDEVIMAPYIMQPIKEGEFSISGNLTYDQALHIKQKVMNE